MNPSSSHHESAAHEAWRRKCVPHETMKDNRGGVLYVLEVRRIATSCLRFSISLADHEISLGMGDEVNDFSVWSVFSERSQDPVSHDLLEAVDKRRFALLAWTNTTWTLHSIASGRVDPDCHVQYTIDLSLKSGALPCSNRYFTFGRRHEFYENLPGDFICEAVDESRGGFHTPHAVGTQPTVLVGTGGTPADVVPFPDPSALKKCVVLGLLKDREAEDVEGAR